MTSRTQFSWNRMNERTKSRFEVIVKSYAPNKNRDKKNQEKANNSPSYRSAAIKKQASHLRAKLNVLKKY